tara:strand:- start:8033 stop:8179 length:147 start_codon:yes stop_codon:yes gene_type:complete
MRLVKRDHLIPVLLEPQQQGHEPEGVSAPAKGRVIPLASIGGLALAVG